jgi:inositol phosphorylceramide synthase catalytic subunit
MTLRALLRSARTQWPRLRLLAAMPFVVWPLFAITVLGEARRVELWALLALGLILRSKHPVCQKIYLGLWPVIAVGALYDTMRFVKNAGLSPERVHACDLQILDADLFGIYNSAGAKVSLHEFFQMHASPFWDAAFAIPYGTFILVTVAFAVWLGFREYSAMRRFTLAFLWVNLLGFITYHVFPAAPPWYVHTYGCGINLNAAASEGPNLMRVDAMMGLRYFHGFYGHSNDVFGAMPSLHVTYPLLIVLSGWSLLGALGRLLSSLFFLSMCVAAVYLDHHWVVDVLVGALCAIVVYVLLLRFGPRSERLAAAHSQPHAAHCQPHAAHCQPHAAQSQPHEARP